MALEVNIRSKFPLYFLIPRDFLFQLRSLMQTFFPMAGEISQAVQLEQDVLIQEQWHSGVNFEIAMVNTDSELDFSSGIDQQHQQQIPSI